MRSYICTRAGRNQTRIPGWRRAFYICIDQGWRGGKHAIVKYALTALLACIAGIAFGQEPATRFDGTWAVTLVAPDSTDAQGKTAKGFTFYFNAQVKDGVLHGEHGEKGKPAWLSLDGKIAPDGTAELTANGIAVQPYAYKNAPTGTPYIYHVKAKFEGAKGSGTREEGRATAFTFVKQ